MPGGQDPRPAHIRNFLECVKSRQETVEPLEAGHHVSTVAHLGNLALRAGRKIDWDHAREQVTGDEEANRMVRAEYRAPWRLPRG